MSVGTRIKERRESLSITQVQLAELLGVSKGAVGNYEIDANFPKVGILHKIFDVLQCDANYLFQDEMKDLPEDCFSAPEIDLVKKYRSLDDHGKNAVLAVLDCEALRCAGSV